MVFLVFTYKYIGFEKNKHRYKKDVTISVSSYIVGYYIITYLTGLFLGFNKTAYSLTFLSILKHIIPVILTIGITEIVRYIFITKGQVNNFIKILIFVCFVMLDINLFFNLYKGELLKFVLMVLVPSISKNILLLYLSYKVGFRTTIVYRLLMEIPMYILPIFPALGIYIDSLLQFLFPMVLLYIIYTGFSSEIVEKPGSRVENKKITTSISVLIFIIMTTYILLNSGILKYFNITIGSNSMYPYIKKGDVVLIEKLRDDEISTLKKGDVLVFKHNNILVIHRIIRIMEVEGNKYFYTKGDNNNGEDGYPISNNEVVGEALFKVPYIGYFTVELNELLHKKSN
jgi:signal peptidase